MHKNKVDILIVGGGMGGCAAAMAAADQGLRVILTEETDWIGGQLTSQAVPPDEPHWIEDFGCTRRYRRFREGVRNYYRENYPFNSEALAMPHLNPGGGNVSKLCHEPRVALAVLEQMLAPARTRGFLAVRLRRRPVAATTDGDQVRSVTLLNLDNGQEETLEAAIVLDATELGDLLRLASVEYVTGAESRDQTGEPHAVAGAARPDNVQAITWCFPMGYDPDCPDGSDAYLIDEPAQYGKWRDYVPQVSPPWSGRLLDWAYSNPITLKPCPRVLFPNEATETRQPLWPYRQIVTGAHYDEKNPCHDVTLVNWPQNDYIEGNLIDRPDEEVERSLYEAKQLSLSLFYWMQREAPRPDGKSGYAGLYLCPDLVGTDDGMAKYPYVRESRRIVAEFTVTENHVGFDARMGGPAERFFDSVGIGSYRIDLHPSTGLDNYIDIASQPFEIPLGALIPVRVENLLAAAKNIGTTHITNGCYRLHPVEWNIGEAAGALAAFCLRRGKAPRQVRNDRTLLEEFQATLVKQGFELAWPEAVREEGARQ